MRTFLIWCRNLMKESLIFLWLDTTLKVQIVTLTTFLLIGWLLLLGGYIIFRLGNWELEGLSLITKGTERVNVRNGNTAEILDSQSLFWLLSHIISSSLQSVHIKTLSSFHHSLSILCFGTPRYCSLLWKHGSQMSIVMRKDFSYTIH